MRKNGFISTTLIYTFFIVFLVLMLFLLNSYSRVRYLLGEIKYDIKNNFSELTMADINLNIFIWNSQSGDYELTKEVPTSGYIFREDYSYCRNGGEENGAKISFVNGEIVISSKGKDFCYAYFDESARDINLRIYIKEKENGPKVFVNKVPKENYELESATCDNGATIAFDEKKRQFTFNSDKTNVNCEAVFLQKQSNITLHIYKESTSGSVTYNGLNYNEVKELPGLNYSFSSYTCSNNNDKTITLTYENNSLKIDTDRPTECNAYFNSEDNNVELILMMETTTGEDGFTASKKYSRTYNIPTSGYQYVGSKCDNSRASVTYKDGVLKATSDTQTTCRAYFDIANSNILIRYHLEKSSGGYENVSIVPKFGYIYSSSTCENGSKVTVDENNVAIVDSTTGDVCDVYYNMVNTDIEVKVYVMNRTTQSWELGNVPSVGYELYNAGCTNNAEVEYKNGKLNIISENPTVCTVYFR